MNNKENQVATKKPAKSTKSAKSIKPKKAPAKVTKSTKSTKVTKKPVARQVKPATLREKAVETANKKPKTRKIRAAAGVASRPFTLLWRGITRVLRPFRFVLKPFKTRPARAVGRFLASVLLLKYFRNSWQELRLVEWPNARQTFQLTVAVFVFAIFFSALISLVDFGLDRAFQQLIIK